MTQKEQERKLSEFQRQMSETICSKREDYAATEDVLSNFKLVAKITGLTPKKVIEVFIATKSVRLSNLSGKDANFESVADTSLDLANYVFLHSLFDIETSKQENNIIPPSDLHYLNYDADLARAKDQEDKQQKVDYMNEPLEVGDYVEVLKWIVDGEYECDAVKLMEGGIYQVEAIYPTGESCNYKVNGYYFPKRVLKKRTVLLNTYETK